MPETEQPRAAPLFPPPTTATRTPEWLQIDWREHLHQVELPGAEAVNYVEIGEGEPIIFVHGIAGCWRNWLENLPYFGRTLPGDRARPARLRRQPDALLGDHDGRLRPPDPRLLRAARDRPRGGAGRQLDGRLRRHRGGDRGAGALRPPGPDLGRRDQLRRVAGPAFDAGRRIFEAAIPLLSGDRRVCWTRPRGRKLAFGRLFRNPNKLRPELLAEQVRPGLQAPGFSDALAAIWGYDTRERLPEIEIPTMVVWGLNDQIVPVEAALGYHRLIPNSRLEIFERTGHLPRWSGRRASTRCSKNSSSPRSRCDGGAGRLRSASR